ncbi:MAG: class I SAM-dependent methyltransferase [Bacillaceae bacterium]|nr:class I SAM-dependent methyltransferase [Bacillaceae bacterium]
MTEDAKKKVIQQFSKNASAYATSSSHSNINDLNRIVEWLKPKKSWKVLDIATGGGHVAKTLAPHVHQVVALDLTEDMLISTRSFLNELANILYVIGDAEHLPFLDETFDVVTCRIAPHHFPDPEKFVQEASRVLKSGGTFLLIDNVVPEDRTLADYMNTFEKLRDPSHVRCLTVREWKQYLIESQLRQVKLEIRKKTYDFPVWVRRTAENDEQIRQVESYILQGSEEQQAYFCVQTSGQQMVSLQIDEMMMMCEKDKKKI